MVQQTRSKRLDDDVEPAAPPAAESAPFGGTNGVQATAPHQNGNHAAQADKPNVPDKPASKLGGFGVRPGAVKIALMQKRPAAAAAFVSAPSVKQQRTEAPSPEGAGLAGLGSYGSDDSP